MSSFASASNPQEASTLNVFCAQEDEAWRVHVNPLWIPKYLASSFDRHGEAFPVLLDFEDLDRQMARYGAERVATTGDVELTAHGRSAHALGEWLSTAFASGIRPSSG